MNYTAAEMDVILDRHAAERRNETLLVLGIVAVVAFGLGLITGLLV